MPTAETGKLYLQIPATINSEVSGGEYSLNDDSLIDALRAALAATPNNVALRIHLGELLLQQNQFKEAEKEYQEALLIAPNDETVNFGLAEAYYGQQKWMLASVVLEQLMRAGSPVAKVFLLAARTYLKINQLKQAAAAYQLAIANDPALADAEVEAALQNENIQLPKAPESTTKPSQQTRQEPDRSNADDRIGVPVEDWSQSTTAELERSEISFKDVGGMEKLKDEIRMKIIHPLTNPEIYKAYGKSIGGGILMYGPPGCGKTHLARATAGEVDAYFISIGIHDVLNMWLGRSEQNLHELFEVARRNTPCVLFIDEIDALGANRSDMRQSAGRLLINQLLTELDGIERSNNGVLILAATNAPWHLDPALRRPGRFDRVIFVPPPDVTARAAILEVMLKDKPAEKMDFEQIAKKTDGLSGADLKAVVDTAIEEKLREAMAKGVPIPLTNKDLLQAARKINASTKDWFATARNYALYSNQGGTYDDVLEYLKMDRGSDPFSSLPFRRNR